MPENKKPVANPLIVLREEFDDWAILFDPDSGDGFGINPVGVLIWKSLDGQHTLSDIIAEVEKCCEGVADEAETHVNDFVQSMLDQGLVGYEQQQGVSDGPNEDA